MPLSFFLSSYSFLFWLGRRTLSLFLWFFSSSSNSLSLSSEYLSRVWSGQEGNNPSSFSFPPLFSSSRSLSRSPFFQLSSPSQSLSLVLRLLLQNSSFEGLSLGMAFHPHGLAGVGRPATPNCKIGVTGHPKIFIILFYYYFIICF
jgi:hypothetical protein